MIPTIIKERANSMNIARMVLVALLAAAGAGRAATTQTQTAPGAVREVRAIRRDTPVQIDGRLMEPLWKDQNGASDFRQSDPVEGAPATERTVVDVAYDDEAIYVAARMYDSSPAGIVARLGRRDATLTTDRFIVYVDPYHDRRTGFYFGLTAAGTPYDGTLYNDTWDDNSWDGVWEGKVQIDDKGWTAEMRIPYSQLRFEKKDVYVWGVNFKREIARKNESDYLIYTPKTESGFVSRFADLVGIESLTPPRRLEIMPYVTTKADFTTHGAGDPFNDGSRFHGGAGADIRTGIGTNLTLNATVNPDFGQVEVDPAVVNLSDVETFFNEKRPFFVEGSSIFDFGSGGATSYWGFNWGSPQFFYSRRIGRQPQGSLPDYDFVDLPAGTRILGAAKLSGKLAGGLSFGALSAVTARESAALDLGGARTEVEIEPLTYYGVARAQKDMDEGRRGIGVIATVAARSFDTSGLRDDVNSSSVATGVDGWAFLGKERTWVLTGWTGLSNVRGSAARMTSVQENSVHYFQRPDADYLKFEPTATSLTGYAGRFTLNKEKGSSFLNAAFGFVSPSFDVNDVGYQWRADVINMHVAGGYRWTKPDRYKRFLSLTGAVFESKDFGFDTTSQGLFHSGDVEFTNYYSANWNFVYNPRSLNSTRTRGGPLTVNPHGFQENFSLNTDDRKKVVFGFGGYAYQSDQSRDHSIDASVEWKPASNLSVSVAPSLYLSRVTAQWIGSFTDAIASQTYGNRYVFARLNQREFSASIRLNWTFTPTLSLQLYAQPFVSAGRYSDYKELARPQSFDFNHYDPRYSSLSGDTFEIDPDGPGPAQPISFGNPNFNYKSLRGNTVLRWEYRPGSTLYLVWTQTREDSETVGDFQLGHSLSRLLGAKADNIFLIKWGYYWNP